MSLEFQHLVDPSTSTGAGEVHEVLIEVHRENVEDEGRHNVIYLLLTPVPVDNSTTI